MINIYLNQVEKELDFMHEQEKEIYEQLRIAEDIFHASEEGSSSREALKIVSLFGVLRYQAELASLKTKISAAQTAIASIHKLKLKEKEERKNDDGIRTG